MIGGKERFGLIVNVAALSLAASLFLPWYSVERPATLGPEIVSGWEAFTRLDAAIALAAAIALLAPAFVPLTYGRILAAVCGAGAALLAVWKIVDPSLIPPVSTAAQAPADFIRAGGVKAGPYVAALAGSILAVAAALDARRRWARRLTLSWPSERTVVFGLLGVGALLRFATLGEQSYWYDEFATVAVVRPGLGGAVDAYMNTESTPPLYYVLAWPWAQVLGTGEFALRSLSALFGTATIGVTYLAGRQLVSGRAGVIAAALVAVNPTLIWYSQEARAYSLLVLMCAVSVLLMARALNKPSARDVALWSAFAALALLTHYFAVFLVAAEGLVLAAALLRRRPAALVPVVLLPAVALALVPLAHAQGGGNRTNWIAGIGLGGRVETITKELVSANTLVINQNTAEPAGRLGYVTAAAVLLALATAGVVAFRHRRRRRPRSGAALPLLLGAGALLIPLLLTQVDVDYLLDRNLLGAWIPLAIGLGAALTILPRWAQAAAVAVVVSGGLATHLDIVTNPGLQRAAWRDGVDLLGERDEGRAIVVIPGFAREMVPFYGVAATLLPPEGINTREIDVVGNFRAAGPYPRVPGFEPVAQRQLPQIGVVELRSREPVLLTPATAAESGLDPGSIMVQYSPRAGAWFRAYVERVQSWSRHLAALEAAAARGEVDRDAARALIGAAAEDRDALLPAPVDLPEAVETTRLVLAADASAAGWATALTTGPASALALARSFDDDLARVPGATETVGATSAAAITCGLSASLRTPRSRCP